MARREGREREITVGLLWHSASSGNLGVGALTVSQIAILRGLAQRRGWRLRFLVIGWDDPEPPYVSGPDIEVAGFRARDLGSPVGALAQAVRRSDLVLDIGAGDSFADIYGAKRAAMNLAAKAMVLAHRRPLILSPQTIGPFERAWVRALALAAMRRAAAVLTRDHLSTRFLAEAGFAGSVVEATDVALRLPYERPAARSEGPPQVGVNISGLLYNGGYTGDNMFGLGLDYRAFCARAVEGLQGRGARVHLIGHVNAERQPVEDDRAACAALAEACPGTVLAPRFADPSAAKSYVAGLDFFAGARMHACIAAFSAGVPVVPLAYSRKFAGLFGSLGYDLTVDLRRETGEAALGRLFDAYENRAGLMPLLQAAMAKGERRLAAYEAVLTRAIAPLADPAWRSSPAEAAA